MKLPETGNCVNRLKHADGFLQDIAYKVDVSYRLSRSSSSSVWGRPWRYRRNVQPGAELMRKIKMAADIDAGITNELNEYRVERWCYEI